MGKDNSTKGELENDIQAVSVSHATGETLQRLAGQRGTISAFMPVCAMAPSAVDSCSSLCTFFCPKTGCCWATHALLGLVRLPLSSTVEFCCRCGSGLQLDAHCSQFVAKVSPQGDEVSRAAGVLAAGLEPGPAVPHGGGHRRGRLAMGSDGRGGGAGAAAQGRQRPLRGGRGGSGRQRAAGCRHCSAGGQPCGFAVGRGRALATRGQGIGRSLAALPASAS